MDIFTILFYQPLYNLLIVLYRVFGGDLGLAIIVVAFLSRLILLPIALRQAKGMEKNKEFNEKMKGIKEKYKNNKEKQQEELMKIQSEYLPAQLPGCLPLIVQSILLININNVFHNLFDKGVQSFNAVAYPFVQSIPEGTVLNTSFLKVLDLNIHPNGVPAEQTIIPYIILIALVGLTQYLSVKIMPSLAAQKKPEEEGNVKDKNKGNKAGDNKAEEDFGEIMAKTTQQTMILFPVMIMSAAYGLASGLSLYWIVQNTFVIIQQLFINRLRKDNK